MAKTDSRGVEKGLFICHTHVCTNNPVNYPFLVTDSRMTRTTFDFQIVSNYENWVLG